MVLPLEQRPNQRFYMFTDTHEENWLAKSPQPVNISGQQYVCPSQMEQTKNEL